jgi:hypothetical protein
MSFAISIRITNLGEVGRECFQRLRLSIFHQVESIGRLLQDPLDGREPPLRHLPGQSRLMLAKEPTEPFVVDRLTGPFLTFGQNSALAVVWMLADDLANTTHHSLLFFARAVRALLAVVVGVCSSVGRSPEGTGSVRSLLCTNPLANLLGRGLNDLRSPSSPKNLQQRDLHLRLTGEFPGRLVA